MTRIFQSGSRGGTRKISGAHSCSWPMQKGHCWFGLGSVGDLDLKSEGRLARAGENMTQRFHTASFLTSGSVFPEEEAMSCCVLISYGSLHSAFAFSHLPLQHSRVSHSSFLFFFRGFLSSVWYPTKPKNIIVNENFENINKSNILILFLLRILLLSR